MSRPLMLLAVVALLLAIAPAAVAEPASPGPAPSASPSSGPAPSPLPAPSPGPASPAPRAIWDYQTQLRLTEEQVGLMKRVVAEFEGLLADARQRLGKLNAHLVEQVQAEGPLDQIKGTLEEIAAIQIQVRMADIRTSRAINHILSPEQLRKWRAMQQQASPTPSPTP